MAVPRYPGCDGGPCLHIAQTATSINKRTSAVSIPAPDDVGIAVRLLAQLEALALAQPVTTQPGQGFATVKLSHLFPEPPAALGAGDSTCLLATRHLLATIRRQHLSLRVGRVRAPHHPHGVGVFWVLAVQEARAAQKAQWVCRLGVAPQGWHKAPAYDPLPPGGCRVQGTPVGVVSTGALDHHRRQERACPQPLDLLLLTALVALHEPEANPLQLVEATLLPKLVGHPEHTPPLCVQPFGLCPVHLARTVALAQGLIRVVQYEQPSHATTPSPSAWPGRRPLAPAWLQLPVPGPPRRPACRPGSSVWACRASRPNPLRPGICPGSPRHPASG